MGPGAGLRTSEEFRALAVDVGEAMFDDVRCLVLLENSW